MAFGLGKLAVLESKLDIYEDLSKEMLDKLERAVASISDNSNRVALVLERHENRLDKSDENDAGASPRKWWSSANWPRRANRAAI